MAAPYLDNLRDLLGTLPEFPGESVECKHFFSGAAAYAGGRIFMSLTPVGLALKLPQAQRRKLIGEGATALRYFPGSPVKKDYVVLPEMLTTNPAALAPLVGEAIELAKGKK